MAGEEVAAALGISRCAGRELVDTARLLAGPLLATATALEPGDIDWGKAKIIAAVLGDVAIEVAITALTTAARATQRTGDPRTTDQLRADTLTHTLLGHPCTPTSDSGTGAHGPGALGGNANSGSRTSASPSTATYPQAPGSQARSGSPVGSGWT